MELTLNEKYDSIKDEPGFRFQKVKDLWEDWKNHYIRPELLDELIQMDYNSFCSNDNPEIYIIREKLFRLIAYIDVKAKDKNIYNDYSDKRVIAHANIRQNDWVKQFLRYKIDKNDLSAGVRNAIRYIEDPINNWPIISENHRKKIFEYYIGKTYHPDLFNKEMADNFDNLWDGLNPMNKTSYFTRNIYTEDYKWKGRDDLEKAMGLLAHDTNDEWKSELEDQITNNFGCIWWHALPTKFPEIILSDLKEAIDEEGYFFFYYIKDNAAYYRARVIDFSLAENYKEKYEEWKEKQPAWMEENFEDYEDGNHEAKIVFLIDRFERLNVRIPISNFILYKNMSYNRRGGLAAYSRILSQDEINNKKNMEEYISLLLSNHNLILTGPPGTGKTYLAKEIAKKLGAEGERCGFVQFHPSYDYTDFIEGLRPFNKTDKKEIGFERKDGVFLDFCRKALKDYQESDNKVLAPKYVFIIDEINRGEISKIFGELFFSIDPGYRGKEGRLFTQYSNLWEEKDVFDSTLKGIDRYKFYVPDNVYIIGTMNDIDRSVESMDFAMRRRFAFKEVTVESKLHMIKSHDKLGKDFEIIEKRINNINLAIQAIPGLGTSFHIGPAYFLKLESYLENDQLTELSWRHLWENHIKGLLFEYLRGLEDSDLHLENLKNAFDMKLIINDEEASVL